MMQAKEQENINHIQGIKASKRNTVCEKDKMLDSAKSSKQQLYH
jgi:hypothetical protein